MVSSNSLYLVAGSLLALAATFALIATPTNRMVTDNSGNHAGPYGGVYCSGTCYAYRLTNCDVEWSSITNTTSFPQTIDSDVCPRSRARRTFLTTTVIIYFLAVILFVKGLINKTQTPGSVGIVTFLGACSGIVTFALITYSGKCENDTVVSYAGLSGTCGLDWGYSYALLTTSWIAGVIASFLFYAARTNVPVTLNLLASEKFYSFSGLLLFGALCFIVIAIPTNYLITTDDVSFGLFGITVCAAGSCTKTALKLCDFDDSITPGLSSDTCHKLHTIRAFAFSALALYLIAFIMFLVSRLKKTKAAKNIGAVTLLGGFCGLVAFAITTDQGKCIQDFAGAFPIVGGKCLAEWGYSYGLMTASWVFAIVAASCFIASSFDLQTLLKTFASDSFYYLSGAALFLSLLFTLIVTGTKDLLVSADGSRTGIFGGEACAASTGCFSFTLESCVVKWETATPTTFRSGLRTLIQDSCNLFNLAKAMLLIAILTLSFSLLLYVIGFIRKTKYTTPIVLLTALAGIADLVVFILATGDGTCSFLSIAPTAGCSYSFGYSFGLLTTAWLLAIVAAALFQLTAPEDLQQLQQRNDGEQNAGGSAANSNSNMALHATSAH